MPRKTLCGLFPLALALVLAIPADGFAKWRGIAEADNRIVFTGRQLDSYRAAHHYLPFAENAHRYERYMARWRAISRRVPVFWVQLQLLAPGRYFPSRLQRKLARYAQDLSWFKGKPFSAGETGSAATVLGQAEYLIFTSGGDRCALFSLYADDGFSTEPDTLGNTFMSGIYCPVSGEVDAGAVKSVLARIGIRGFSVPEAEEPQAASDPGERLAQLVTAGDIRGLRRAAAKGLDPDTLIVFDHPRFARGRAIRRPMLMAAALFGHTEIVVFLLDKGAATAGSAAGAICAAIAMNHLDIVEALLERDPALARFDGCGPYRTETAFAVAMRLGHLDVAEALHRIGR